MMTWEISYYMKKKMRVRNATGDGKYGAIYKPDMERDVYTVVTAASKAQWTIIISADIDITRREPIRSSAGHARYSETAAGGGRFCNGKQRCRKARHCCNNVHGEELPQPVGFVGYVLCIWKRG